MSGVIIGGVLVVIITAFIFVKPKPKPEIVHRIPTYNDKHMEGKYVDGGIFRGKLYSDGDLIAEGDFFDGVLHGRGKKYSYYIQLVSISVYDRYQRVPGYKTSEGLFHNGILVEGKKYLPDGRCQSEGTFNSRSIEKGTIFRGEHPHMFGNFYLDDSYGLCLGDGYGKVYYPNGSIQYEGIWRKEYGLEQGSEFYETGQIKYEGSFNNMRYSTRIGQLVGDWHGQGKYYDENGFLCYEGIFEKGKPKQIR